MHKQLIKVDDQIIWVDPGTSASSQRRQEYATHRERYGHGPFFAEVVTGSGKPPTKKGSRKLLRAVEPRISIRTKSNELKAFPASYFKLFLG